MNMQTSARTYFFAAIFLLPSVAFASSVSISIPGTLEYGNTASVYAYYYDNNSVFVPDANCILSGGFLSGERTLTYNPAEYYLYSLYLSASGSQTFTVSCSKAGVDTAQTSTIVDILKASSGLSVSGIQSYTEVDNTVYINARYSHSGIKISGANCNMRVTTPSGAQPSISSGEGADGYYGQYTLTEVGRHTFTVDCSSANYLSASATANTDATKRSAAIRRPIIPAYYPGDVISLYYSYTSSGYAIAGANCNYELKKGTSVVSSGTMPYSPGGYLFSVSPLAASESAYRLKVSCSKDKYSYAEDIADFYVRPVPTRIAVTTSTPSGAYSYAPLGVSARYEDARKSTEVPNPACSITFLGSTTQGKTLASALPPVSDRMAKTITVCCEKSGYAKACKDEYLYVSPQNLAVKAPSVFQFVAGENSRLTVMATPQISDNNNVIECSADAVLTSRSYSDKRHIEMSRTPNALNEHYLDISFDRPGDAVITVACSGDGYATARTDITSRVKMFSKSQESTMTVVLAAVTLFMVAIVALLKRKYKMS